MADRKQESLKCYVHRFGLSLDFKETKKIQICYSHRFISIEKTDSSLEIVKFDSKKPTTKCFEDVQQCVWCKDFRQDSNVCGCLICLKKEGTLVCYDNHAEVLLQQNITDIESLETQQGTKFEIKDLHLISYYGNNLVIQRPYDIVVLEVLKTGYKNVISVPLTNSKPVYNKFDILGDFLAVFDGEKSVISLYSINNGSVVATLDLSHTNVDTDRLLSWRFTADLKYLVTMENTSTITTIDVESYIKQFPSCVTRGKQHQEKFSQNEVFNTIHVGDITWRKKLLNIHDRNSTSLSNPWYIEQNSNIPKTNVQKKKWRVSGFWKKDKSAEDDHVHEWNKKLHLPATLQGMNVINVVVGKFSASLHLQSPKENVICVCDILHQTFNIQRLPVNCIVMLSEQTQFPHLVAMETHLTCIIPCIEQEDFVSMMMSYAGASVADVLCHINKWGRCSLPLHTLDIGVKHRQLDTVVFFLKSKENLFSSTKSSMTSPASPAMASPSWSFNTGYYDNMTQIQPALELLIQAISDNMTDIQSQGFVQKLSDITLEFLYGILSDALDVQQGAKMKVNNVTEMEDIQKSIDVILTFISDVRQCLRQIERQRKLKEGVIEEERVPAIKQDRSIQEVLEEAVLSNNIPTIQASLIEMGDNSMASIDNITKSSIVRAVHYLSKKQSKPAIAILSHLGLNVNDQLWKVASFCEYRTIVNFIVEELSERKCLTEEQLEVIKYDKILREKYPCSSFATAVQSARKEEAPLNRLENIISSTYDAPVCDLTSECGEIYTTEQTSTAGKYAQVLLNWIQQWDTDTRQLVIMESNPEEVTILHLRYWLRHNDIEKLLSWIQKADKKQYHMMYLLLECMYECTSYIQYVVSEACARKGVFMQTEDFDKLLDQLRLVGGALRIPHPITHQPSEYLISFHTKFLQYCMRKNLPLVVWQYFSTHGLPSYLMKEVMQNQKDNHWLSFLSHMYQLGHEPKDSTAMFEASVSNGQLVWSLDTPSITEMMKKGEVMTAMATLMFCKSKLKQVTHDNNTSPMVTDLDNTELEAALEPYPKLHSAIFPTVTKETQQNDVTVYQLLMNNAPFDPRKLFGWQSVNTLATDESPKTMPYFSQQELVTKFGYVEKIRYMYYLKQGRPSFAFVSFLAEAYDMEPTGITQQRIQDAANTALWIGVKNFHNTQVACTCVVFMEMLGQDTCLLRTYLQVGNIILTDMTSTIINLTDKSVETNQKNEIVSWMCACVLRRGKHAKFLLQKLEDAIIHNLDKESINRTSFEAGQKWTVAVLFCHLLNIPPSTKYLEMTAKSDKWLPFLWFSQMHQYSKEQLQGQLYHFKSQHLQQHLHYVIENAEVRAQVSKVNEKSSTKKKGSKDVRSNLYSRIGLSKDVNQVPKQKKEKSSSDEEEETEDVRQSLEQIDDNEIILPDIEAVSDDLFSVVFHAQSSRSPWKYLLASGITVYNPILIELAACLPNANLITCLCGWLVSMMNRTEHDKFVEDHGKTIWKLNLKHLNLLIEIYLQNKWNKTLMTSFHIFTPDCTILPFLRFSEELVDTRNYGACRSHFQDFKEAVSMASSSEKSDQQNTTLNDPDWLQQTVYKILTHHMTQTTNLFDLLQLLKILDTESAVLLFKFDVPDFGRLSRLLSIVVNNQILELNFTQLLLSNEQFEEECERVIMCMINRGLFQAARDFLLSAGLSSDHVTLFELRSKKEHLEKSSVWKSRTARNKFWLQCFEILQHYKADGVISQFYLEEAKKVDDLLEKSYLYQLCLDHLEQSQNQMSYDELYRKMWICRIQQRAKHSKQSTSENEEIDDIFYEAEPSRQLHSKKDLICYGKLPQHVEIDSELNLKEDKALNDILEELLDSGHVCECCRLSAEFKHYSQDLTIIQTCIRLALGEITMTEHMDMDMVKLIAGGHGKLHRASISSPAVLSGLSRNLSVMTMGPVTYSCFGIEMEKVVNTMETLCSHCNHGNHFCKQIINCFVISLVLTMDYQTVVTSEEFEILKSLLMTDFPHKLKLAADFLTNSSLSPEVVAGFLSDSFVEAYKVKHGLVSAEEKGVLMLDETKGVVTSFIKLCPDSSLLGDRLLDAVTSLSGVEDLLSPKVLAIQTDLLILAHSCHTVSCNMEGISNVLRSARAMTSCLQSTQQFSLMVQLLTGIGRFGEMIYIFDSLKQNDQFELLLKKGIERENSLKLAILDYLKRYHQKDKDTYDMVACNFMLHREIAQSLETRAYTALDGLEHKTFENSDYQTTLQNIIQYFTDAAESYFKEKCVRHAQKCVRQARLVALQLQYLSAGMQLLHLNDEVVDATICRLPKFLEALIVSQAYGRKGNWTEALCQHVIMNGDFKYLQDFKQHLKLTSLLIKEVVERYKHSSNKTGPSLSNVKKLLTFCKDIKLQYNLAVELSLKDVVTSLENSDSGSYIKDIIMNKV